MYYSAAKAAGERARFEEKIQQMQSFLDAHRDEYREFGPAFEKYFFLHRDKESGMFVYAEPKLQMIRDELELCGYFAIITSEQKQVTCTVKERFRKITRYRSAVSAGYFRQKNRTRSLDRALAKALLLFRCVVIITDRVPVVNDQL